MSAELVDVYIAALPVIEAEESIMWLQRLQIGTGQVAKKDAQPIIDAWSEAARMVDTQKKRRRIDPGRLAYVGIGVKTVHG